MRKTSLVAALTAILVVAGLTIAWVSTPNTQLAVTTVPAYAQSDTTQQAITDSGNAAVKQAIQAVGPSVVLVDVIGTTDVSNSYSDLLNDPFFQQFFGDRFNNVPQQQETESVGSGFAIDYEGTTYILTNAHVVDGADQITLTSPDGHSWPADVVGSDDMVDVAVLKPQGDISGLATAQLGDSSQVELGDWVIAIGNPLGLSYTVTLGIISSTNRDIAKPSGVGTYYNLLQTDAAINPGNSGGPLVDAAGNVVGINTLIARSSSSGVSVEGINFAISINSVRDILAQLIDTGSVARGWVGIAVSDITPDTAEAFDVDPEAVGALVVEVFPGDPGAKAGLEAGDIITRVNDVAIQNSDEFVRQIGLLGPGADASIDVMRGTDSMSFTVTLGTRPSEEELVNYQGSSPNQSQASALGLTVGPITPIVAQHLGLNSTDGVVIISVDAGSRADAAGLAEGDIVLEVNHQSVSTVAEWTAAVSAIGQGDQITLTVLHNGHLGFVTL